MKVSIMCKMVGCWAQSVNNGSPAVLILEILKCGGSSPPKSQISLSVSSNIL